MDYRQLIIDSGKRMVKEKLTVETWGNISCLGEDGLMYITPSSMDYSAIKPEDVAVMDLEGRLISGRRKPSIEYALHMEIYKARPEIKAIVHTHPVNSTVFSCMGENIPLFMDEAVQSLGDVVRTTEYELPGTEELAKAAVKAMGDKGYACLIRSHGAVCTGKTMDQAFKVATVLEMCAEILIKIRSCGGSPIPISDENIAEMRRRFNL